MHALRDFALSHRRLAGWVVALALAMKLLVPTGYMISVEQGRPTITLCGGLQPVKPAVAMPGMRGMAGHHEGEREHEKRELPCAFSGLAFQALAAADPVLIADAIRYVMVAAFRPVAYPAPADAPRLRPPPRGPPALPTA